METFLIVAAVIALLILLCSCLRVVPQASQYVIEFLGKYRVTWSAGLHFKIPFLEKIAKKVTLKEQVLDSHRVKVQKAYPAYFDTYEEIGTLIDYLNTYPNLYCIGRNGQHRYNNMDHSMVTAFEAVKCIKNKSADRSAIWNVNTEAEYHEEV